MAEDKLQQKEAENSEENLWASVLSEVQTSRSSQLPASKNLLVLGDKESGKTTLVAKLQGNEDPKKGAGLEYGYDVRDEYRDDHTRLGHWILDGDLAHSHLLRFALKESNFTDTTVMLCVSMTTPWNIMDQLQNWATLLHDHIDKLTLSAEETKRLQNENIRRWQSYTEPGDETDTGSPSKRVSRNMDQSFSERLNIGADDDLLPLSEDTLARNLGLDLIVVVTKTDFMADLERDYDYKEEHFDFIQQSIRSFCLQFGAALFYASVKEDKNCDLLYKYLVHRIYRFPFKTPALVVEKDAVFIPAGWDSSKKIAILHENMHSMKPDQYYTDVIARPMTGLRGIHGKTTTDKPRHELEVTAEDEQQFLLRQQQYLQQGAQPGMTPQSGMPGNTMGAGIPKTPNRKDMGSPGVQGSPTKKMEPGKLGAGGNSASEGVLANFFNSLLSNKRAGAADRLSAGGVGTGSPAAASNSPGGVAVPSSPIGQKPLASSNDDYKASVRSDAAAELDRLTRAQKKGGGTQGGSTANSIDVINNSSEC